MSSKNKNILLATALCGIAVGAAAVEKNLESAMEKSPASASKKPEEKTPEPEKKTLETKSKAQEAVTLEVEKCWGIHACKGLSACDVERSDIDAADAAFNNKFAESVTYHCSGEVYGPAKDGYLGWVYVEKGYCLKIENGFLIEKDKNGEKVVIKREIKGDKKDDKNK